MPDPIPGVIAQRDLPDGRIVCLVPLLGDRVRLTVGVGTGFYDDGW